MYELKLDAARRTLDAWSSKRLPFEPKGELLQFRHDIRTALRQMRTRPGDGLAATYESVATDVCDIENVLMYNVGTAAFSHLGVASVHLSRVRRSPAAALSGTNYLHHVRYELLEPRRLHPAPMVRFETAEFRLSSQNPWPAWLAGKRGRIEGLGPIPTAARLGISVSLHVAPSTQQPFGLVKPLLDGLIAAMHVHDGSSLEIVVPLVAAKAQALPAEAQTLLMDETAAVLGRRRLVWPFGAGIQMNPADDRFDEVTVEFHRGTSGSFKARGEIFIAG